MKKDISIPKSTHIKLAIVYQYNNDFRTYDWNVYLINSGNVKIETVLILSKGYDHKRSTSVLRHKIELLPEQSIAKIEFLHKDILQLNNTFKITYFSDNHLFEKDFLIKKHTITKESATNLPWFNKSKGFLFE